MKKVYCVKCESEQSFEEKLASGFSNAKGQYIFATNEEATKAVELCAKLRKSIIGFPAKYSITEIEVPDGEPLDTTTTIIKDANSVLHFKQEVDFYDQPFFTATPLSEYLQMRQIDEEKKREQWGTLRSSNLSSFPTQSSSQQALSRPAPSSGPTGCLVPLLIGFSSMILSLVTIAFCFAGLMTVAGCGPSESQVQKDFNRMASRRGVPISGSARVNKMHRVRVDGQRKEVWSVNYDVPNANGTKTWKTTYMTYEDGKPKVIRTDTQGWVR